MLATSVCSAVCSELFVVRYGVVQFNKPGFLLSILRDSSFKEVVRSSSVEMPVVRS